MIIKSFELNKVDLKKNNLFLLYGENQGHKNETIKEKFKKFYSENIYHYDENDILSNQESFFNNILSKSFFENEKLIVINRASDKIYTLIEEIIEKKIEETVIVLNANTLEKKSKLRSLFEKNKATICVAFYEDNSQTLSTITNKFFRDKKIPISQQSINIIVQRSRGDRQNLKSELEKIESFIKNKTKIETRDILKLTNLAENYTVSELVDGCLAKNRKKTINILNENNYSLDDCMLIIRTFLIKAKRLLRLNEQLINTQNIDSVITTFKPPIFWKDKEIVKEHVKNWSQDSAEDLIYKINDIELLLKKNPSNSINILSDFIIEQSSGASN